MSILLRLIDYPPKFREAFSTQTLEPGPPLSLKCIAAGIPIPQITWQLDDSPIPESFRVRFGDYVTKVRPKRLTFTRIRTKALQYD